MSKKKNSANELEKNIIELLLEQKGKPINIKQIYGKLPQPKPENFQQILPTLEQLNENGEIVQYEKFKYLIPQKPKSVQGIVDINRRGTAFLIVDGHDEDYIIFESKVKLLQNDKVEANLFAKNKKTKAQVTKLIHHSTANLVGTLNFKNNNWYLTPNSGSYNIDFWIKSDKDFKPNQKVIFKIKNYNPQYNRYESELVEILGQSGENQTEMHAILAEFNLPHHFPEEVNKFSENIKFYLTKHELENRIDFRNKTTFTIDPETAKDFDDALSVEFLENGCYKIGIHIADVTHYVKPNDIIDKEAQQRATSVYLVDRVVPMLPFNLSDNLCSLVPNQDRFTMSVIVTIDKNFQIIDTQFSKTIIHSDRRFSYEEVQTIIDNGEGEYYKEINTLNQIALKLTKERFEKGALSFETTETRFKLDENGKPIDVYVKERKQAHKLVEEWMLLANRKVAQWVYELKPRPPFVYRTHDEPPENKIEDLRIFLKKFGYNLETDTEHQLRHSLNEISFAVEGKPEQDTVRQMSIRSMAKAVYTMNKPSHFGLAFPFYTHFTSPIRRYPDMMVHRLLHAYLNKQTMENATGWDNLTLDKLCKHSSKMEQQATDAERASIKYKQAEYLEDKIGEIFMGVITGLTDWGIFVEIKNIKCEGLIKLQNINDDYYDFDPKLFAVIGRKRNKRYRMGDEVVVKVKNANRLTRTIDLQLITENDNRKRRR